MRKVEIKKVKEIVEYAYEAGDGTQFKSSDECEKYEQTYKCVIRSRFNEVKKSSFVANSKLGFVGTTDFVEEDYLFTPKIEAEIFSVNMYVKYDFGDNFSGNFSSMKVGRTYVIQFTDSWAYCYDLEERVANALSEIDNARRLANESSN